MKAKPNKKPALRSRNGQRRDKLIRVFVSDNEHQQIKATHGRYAAALARLFLLGLSTPKKPVITESGKMAIVRALHCHTVAVQKASTLARNYEDPALQASVEKSDETLSHLMRVCLQNFLG